MPPSTSCTCRASPTATATGSATWPASGPGCPISPSSASTRSGSARGTPRRGPTRAMTWPTIAPSTRPSARLPTPGEWYLHLFAPEQPDFNWANPEVRQEFEDILRFWFDRGVDGVRIDSAALLTKDPALPGSADSSPYSDRDDVHDIYRAWRKVA